MLTAVKQTDSAHYSVPRLRQRRSDHQNDHYLQLNNKDMSEERVIEAKLGYPFLICMLFSPTSLKSTGL